MINGCYVGDVRDGLRAFIAAGHRARTCVTSPPYWGLRDYGVRGQLGLEPTIAEYVANMVDVFRLVRDALTDDGTLWLNLGDSYANDAKWGGSSGGKHVEALHGKTGIGRNKVVTGLKPKDLCGIPWRVAFALQADGWHLRSDIIWAKPNPMPESVTDRPTKAHEYLFLLAKSERYYYDAAAIAEPAAVGARRFNGGHSGNGDRQDNGRQDSAALIERNRRTVWTIATEPYRGAHFAVMPTALVEPCVLAGSAPGDVVVDPFMGSGTVAMVAQSLGRRWFGTELNPAYVAMQKRRAAQLGLELVA